MKGHMHQQYEVFTEDGSLRDSLRRMRERLDKLENPHQGEDYRIAADGEPGLCEICKEAHYTDEKCESLWQTPLDELTPTCGPKDWYEPAEMLWCPIHHQLAVQCGQPPATDASTKDSPSDAAQRPACQQPWAVHKRESEGTVSCPVSTPARTQPSSPRPTYATARAPSHVGPCCACATEQTSS